MSIRILWLPALTATLVLMSIPAAAQELPPGNGQALVMKNCTACHDLDGTVQLRKTREEWESIVIDMIGRGAPLFIEEVDPIIGYLADAFGPKAPPIVDVNTAVKDELVKLTGVTPQLADRLIAYRTANGSFMSLEQVRTVLGISNDAFDRIKAYVRLRQ